MKVVIDYRYAGCQLTELEHRRASMVLRGAKLADIAEEERVSIYAVKQTMHKVYRKLAVGNKLQLALKLYKEEHMRSILALVLLAIAPLAFGQTSSLPPATPAQTVITITYPAACTTADPCTAQVFRCTGTQTVCTLTSSNWTPIAAVSNNGTSYTDTTGVAGTAYTYEVTNTQTVSGVIVDAGPSNFYTGTPTAPLAPATISGVTS